MGLLSIDVGTSGTKVILFSETGESLCSAYVEYAHIYPGPGWVELVPEVIWAAVQKTVRDVSGRCENLIEAVSVSSMGRNIVPIKEDGTAIHNVILSADTRANEEADIICDTIGEKEFFQITGSRPSVTSALSRILWLKRNEPGIFNQTWKFMTTADFVLMRMGFPPLIDYSMAASNVPFDLRKNEYAAAILKEFGLSDKLFSDPLPSGHLIGEIGLEARTQLDLPKGVKMVTGGIDASCGVLGSGVTHLTPTMMADFTGSFEGVAIMNPEPVLSQGAFDTKVRSYNSVINDTYLVVTALPTAGSLVRWFRDELASEERIKAVEEGSNIYDIMFEPLKFDGGTIMVLPYFSGSSVDGYAKGAILGLTMATSRQELLKGVVEGVTHELRLLADRLEGVSGNSFDTLRACGGHTKSRKWLQLKADVVGKKVEAVQVEDASNLGAALLAGVATGVYDSIEQALEATVKIKDAYEPRPEIHQIYERQHEVYRRIIEALNSKVMNTTDVKQDIFSKDHYIQPLVPPRKL